MGVEAYYGRIRSALRSILIPSFSKAARGCGRELIHLSVTEGRRLTCPRSLHSGDACALFERAFFPTSDGRILVSMDQAPDPNDPHYDPSTLIARAGARWAGDLQDGFRREVASLLGRSQLGFPGAQPVSFSASHFAELKRADYYVCEKTDGTRYLMWSTSDAGRNIVYLIDRKNDYYYMPRLFLPHQENKPGTFDRFHDHTILDGELVEDRRAWSETNQEVSRL